MLKGIIRNAKELQNIGEKNGDIMWVAWGTGERGYLFLREVRIHKINNVYVYDSNEKSMQNERERIFYKEITEKINDIFFIITVANDKIVNEIVGQISELGGKEIYRYIPVDKVFLSDKLSKMGLYNGITYKKVLEDSEAKKLIEQKILGEEPFLFARWGAVEGNIVYGNRADMLTDLEINALKNNAGFYPLEREFIHKFAEIYADSARDIDILCVGLWFTKIEECYAWYSSDAVLVSSIMKNPFWSEVSWTWALHGKTVLVIHPFAKLIKEQYQKRDLLFEKQNILPQMRLKVYEAVQSMGGNKEFLSWFDALKKMEDDISKMEFDVALIGCGAYGMPLGAFIKSKMRKASIHLGGTLQLLFGIKGKRWDNSSFFHSLYNEYWVRPTEDLRPQNYKTVEDGCYW